MCSLVVSSLVDDTVGRYTAGFAGGDAHHLVSLLQVFFYSPLYLAVTCSLLVCLGSSGPRTDRSVSVCSLLGGTADTCSSQSTLSFCCDGISTAPCIWQPLVRCLAGVHVCGFPYSAVFGSTVDAGLCLSTEAFWVTSRRSYVKVDSDPAVRRVSCACRCATTGARGPFGSFMPRSSSTTVVRLVLLVTIGVLGYGFCFATETVTHRAICATSCLDKDVDMPVVVLDRCPVSVCRKLWSPAVALR